MTDTTLGKVLFVLPVLGQPRDAKRIAMLQRAGFTVEAAAFDRTYHRGRLPDCAVEILAKIEHKRYIRRFITFVMVVPKLRRAIRRADIVYASGPDMGLAAILAARPMIFAPEVL